MWLNGRLPVTLNSPQGQSNNEQLQKQIAAVTSEILHHNVPISVNFKQGYATGKCKTLDKKDNNAAKQS